MAQSATIVSQVTAPAAGAVGILQLHGPASRSLLQRLTGRDAWPLGRFCLTNLGGIDTGLAVLWRDGDMGWAQLFPHGSPLVLRELIERLLTLGAQRQPQVDPKALFPEARSELEAQMLAAISECPSAAAVDLLLRQPRNWRQWLDGIKPVRDRQLLDQSIARILERSRVLERYRHPPRVAVWGVPNVGKSTLTNQMLGRTASLVADHPGTTRDWVAGLFELHGITICWMDTPGLRTTDDPVENQAMLLAEKAIAQADVVVLMRDAWHDWPPTPTHAGQPCLKVWNKIDRGLTAPLPAGVLGISAQTGQGVDALGRALLTALELPALPDELWAFSPSLQQSLTTRNWDRLRRDLGM